MKAVVGKKYIHYKNRQTYQVLSIGIHTETGERLVVYEGQYEDAEFGHKPVWIRPRTMFEEQTEYQGKMVERFALL